MRQSTVLISIFVVLLAGVAGYFWYIRAPEPVPLVEDASAPPAPEATVSTDVLRDLLAHRNRGIATLENEDFAAASTALRSLCELAPGEPLGFCNLCIAEVLQLQGLDPARDAEAHRRALASAETAIEQLQRVAPDELSTWVLTARVQQAAGQTAGAIASLTKANDVDPENAAAWFELYKLASQQSDADSVKLSRRALELAYRHAPGNLFVLQEWLRSEAQAESPGIIEVIEASRESVAAVAKGIEQQSRYNPLQFLDEARSAAEQADWRKAKTSVTLFGNIMKSSDVSRSDLTRVELHPLELVMTQFVTIDPARIVAMDIATDEAIEVRWTAAAVGLPMGEAVTGLLSIESADFDLDGRLDLAVLSEGRVDVWRRLPDAGGFSSMMSLAVPVGYSRLLAVELDQDADPLPAPTGDAAAAGLPEVCHTADLDLVLSGPAGVLCLRNDLEAATGNRRLSVIDAAGTGLPAKPVEAVDAVDINSDGDLDLVTIAGGELRIWSNRGEFLFEDVTVLANPPQHVTAVLAVDLDRDIDLDLVLGLQDGRVGYLENLRHGHFRWREIPEARQAAGPITGIDVTDVDRNRSWDLLVTTASGLSVITSQTIQPGEVRFAGSQSIEVQGATLPPVTFDYDNDGFDDVLLANGATVLIARGVPSDAGLSFVTDEVTDTPTVGAINVVRTSDFDGDGDTDILAIAGGELRLWRNDGGNANGWLAIGLMAQQVKGEQSSSSGRVNHYGVGSLLEVFAGPHYQPRIVRAQQTLIGLGNRDQADALRVVWTNGIPENIIEPAAKQYVCERQTLKGSCPYLYTWDGERFVFCTDLLWAAPIGLRDATGRTVPDRSWEYILVTGDQLREVDGVYRLAITEELWEAAYFDQVELLAVDHPADVQVFSNEKVGPPSIAEFKLHTARTLHAPRRVVNHAGRDLTAEVLHADEVYAQPFESKLRQGYTADSWIEIDLGLERARRLTMLLTGWVYPTDTSINVAAGGEPRAARAAPALAAGAGRERRVRGGDSIHRIPRG
ncbi:MAG: FG-GAP-like repeat-containing protein [Planctomycetaceae bacterium]